MAQHLGIEEDVVQCLVGAVRVQCRSAGEAKRIVEKVLTPQSQSVSIELQNRISNLSEEECWAMAATAFCDPPDASDRQKLEHIYSRLIKVEKQKMEGYEWPTFTSEFDFKQIQERLQKHFAPAYNYPVFSEREAFEKWDAIDLAEAQHRLEQWRLSKDDKTISGDADAFSFLEQCGSIAGHLEVRDETSEGPSVPVNTKRDDLQTILDKYPFPRTAEERKLWIRVAEVAAIEKTVDTATLRQYRSSPPAEKTPDGLAGRDKDGRIWRKPDPNGHVLYLISSLRNATK